MQALVCNVSFEWINEKKKNFVFWIDFYQKNVVIFSGIKLFFYKQD